MPLTDNQTYAIRTLVRRGESKDIEKLLLTDPQIEFLRQFKSGAYYTSRELESSSGKKLLSVQHFLRKLVAAGYLSRRRASGGKRGCYYRYKLV